MPERASLAQRFARSECTKVADGIIQTHRKLGADATSVSRLVFIDAATFEGFFMTDIIFRRRRLPHQDVEGHPVFITACLAGSLSASGLSQVRQLRDQLDDRPRPAEFSEADWEHHKQKLLFALVDNLLDHDPPVTHLKDER